MPKLSENARRLVRMRDRKKIARPSKAKKARPAASLPKTGDAMADWASARVYEAGRLVAWEGTAAPFTFTRFYPANLGFLGSIFPQDQASNINWLEAIYPLDREKVKRHLNAVTTAKIDAIEYRLIDKSGALVWVRQSFLFADRVGSHFILRGYIQDIQAEKEYQLESLRVSEREQNQIGQDLHDDLCQVLAGVSCLMRVVEGKLAAKMPEEVGALTEINQQIVDAMHRTRALTHGLFPGKIQIADIRGALLELAGQIRTRFNVEVAPRFTGRFPKHSSAQIIQIYRLAQEAITNAIKHGRATHIAVELAASSDTMTLSITDNGSGFPNGKKPSSGGVGLHIMQYRAGLLGGELTIENGTKDGVIVSLSYPFESNRHFQA